MKATVTQKFQDRITMNHYEAGQIIDVTDKNRLSQLVAAGVVKVEEEKAEDVAEKPLPKKKKYSK